MSTLRGDLEQNSPIDFDPLAVPHYASSGGSSPSHGGAAVRSNLDSPLAFGESSGDIEHCSPGPHEESGEERDTWKDDLCHAICVNNWSDAKVILKRKPNALTAKIDNQGRTPLHVAAMFGHITIVEELLTSLPPQFLETPDLFGDTALGLACRFTGITQVAKCLVNKNYSIVYIPNRDDNLPVTVAFADGCQEMGRFLYSVTPLEYLTGCRGSRLLRYCFRAQCFDIALDLLQKCTELLFMPVDNEGWTPIHEIATLNTAIVCPSELIFWKKWIYDYINIPSTTSINHVSVDIQQDKSQGHKVKLTEPGVKKLQELKLLHAQADGVVRLVCRNAREAHQKGVIDEALCLAAREGNVQFVFQVSRAIPEICLSKTMVLCFHTALDYRQAKVFNLIHGFRFKHRMVTMTPDNDPRNTMMHKVAIKAPDHVLNRIYGPAFQMQRELQWFKEVESVTPPNFRVLKDNKGRTAEESFREHHRELMKQGEEWIKATASSYSLVGFLIVTITFAVAFTLPGGNDQNYGFPLFMKQPTFNVFILSTVVSLVSSSTSVLMFLAILTSPFSEEAFLNFLPSKLLFGVSTLLISVVAMIITFLSAIRLTLKHSNYHGAILPIILFTSVPISYSLWSLIPVIRSTAFSAYGTVFDRKVTLWP
ncbi:uncharacterized protein LOC114714740 [Neltuma alba]|uniref:uncharacterized protein LOC114714740 n=1 Tax=Neltuma alba TaxID=207710 RepID=UPI0010A2E50A|nr:uncharacterized protein LOC114714740 [Prosopis alba]